MSLRSSAGSGVRWAGASAIVATAALGAAALPVQAAPNTAPQAIPGGDSYVVALGDSYISGEGAITSNRGYSSPAVSDNWTHYEVASRSTTIGPKTKWGYSGLVYGDKDNWGDKNAQEEIEYCHRSFWNATNGLTDGGTEMKFANLACSGATTNSKVSGGHVKPGIDFGVGSTTGQATLLKDFAQTNRVKVVTLSIGGNDAGFADIASACIQGFVTSFFGKPCNNDPKVTALVTPQKFAEVKQKIKGAVANVVSAMDQAGYARTDWKLVYQQVPMPVANGVDIPIKESAGNFFSKQRQTYGGCGMYDADLNWIYTYVFPNLAAAMKGAIEESKPALGDTPVVYVDNTNSFEGHKLCQKGVVNGDWNVKTVNAIGDDPARTNTNMTTQFSAPFPHPENVGWNGPKSEWVTPVYALDQLSGDPHRKQNPLHPNYWGQRALGACLDQALTAGDNKVVTCAQKADKSQDAKGRPAMELASNTDIVFATAPGAPTLDTIASRNMELGLSFTAPTDTGGKALLGYEYALDPSAPDAEWLQVPAGSGTAAAPEQPALITEIIPPGGGAREPLQNGNLYPIFVRAVNEIGAGPASNGLEGTPYEAPPAPVVTGATPLDFGASVEFTQDPGGTGQPSYEYRIVAPAEASTAWLPVGNQHTSPVTITNLPAEVLLSMELRAVNPGGESAGAPFQVTPGPVGANFFPLDAPVRLVNNARITSETKTYDVATLAGTPVPADATALAINLTVANPTGPGHAEIYPGDAPDVVDHSGSVINWIDGERLANGINVTIVDGKFKLRSVGDAAFSVDVVGYYQAHTAPGSVGQPAGGTFLPLPPVRAFEQVVNPGDGTVASGVVVDLGKDKDGGQLQDMSKVSAVVYNVTATGATGPGHLRVQPYTSAPNPPLTPTSALNWFGAGDVVANSSVAKPGEDGKVVIYVAGGAPVKVIVDIMGYFVTDDTGMFYYPIAPVRTFDSRVGEDKGVISDPAKAVVISNEIDRLGNVFKYDVIPANAGAIAANFTEAGGTARGHFRVFPGGDDVPNASLINWPAAGHNRANATMIGVDNTEEGEKVSIFGPNPGAHALVDVLGYYAVPVLP